MLSLFLASVESIELRELDALSRTKQYFDLRERVENHTSSNLEVLFFKAEANEKFNRLALANSQYNQYIRAKGNRAPQALRAMAYNYAKLGQYGRAADTYRRLRLNHDINDRADIANVEGLWGALRRVPPQTVRFRGDSDIPISRSFNVPVKANGQTLNFIFDTGANISTVSETYAKKLGLRMIDTKVMVGGITGASTRARLGVSRELRFGNVIVRNVVFLVFPDRDLFIKAANYQLNAILGYPVISAMREITLTRNGRLKVPSKVSPVRLGNLALDGLTPLVLGRYGSHRLTFAFDSGANTSMLYPPFLIRFEPEVTTWENTTHRFAGVGSAHAAPAFLGKNLELKIGGQTVRFPRIPVLKQNTTQNSRSLYGNLGQDMIRQFESVTISFATMSLSFGKRVQ